jgi:hypothetical protein
VLVGVSLSRDPLADERRTASEFDSARLTCCEGDHAIAVDQFYLCEVDGDDATLLKRGAKDVEGVSRNPPTETQNDTAFNPYSVDPAGHRLVAGRANSGEQGANWTLNRADKDESPHDPNS